MNKTTVSIIVLYVLVLWMHFAPQLQSLYYHYHDDALAHVCGTTDPEGEFTSARPSFGFDWLTLSFYETKICEK